MAKKIRKTNSKRNSHSFDFKTFLGNTQNLSLLLVVIGLGVFFVLIRMKRVEQDYKFNEINKKVELALLENKDLKAIKAQHLSVKNLRQIAEKYNMSEPSQDKIIIVP